MAIPKSLIKMMVGKLKDFVPDYKSGFLEIVIKDDKVTVNFDDKEEPSGKRTAVIDSFSELMAAGGMEALTQSMGAAQFLLPDVQDLMKMATTLTVYARFFDGELKKFGVAEPGEKLILSSI